MGFISATGMTPLSMQNQLVTGKRLPCLNKHSLQIQKEVINMEAKLIVNGVAVELNYSTLFDISLSLSSSKANRAIFHELAKSPCSEIREQVANMSSLDDETIDILIHCRPGNNRIISIRYGDYER
jgi:hypothetical protein